MVRGRALAAKVCNPPISVTFGRVQDVRLRDGACGQFMTDMGAERNGKSRPEADMRLSRIDWEEADLRSSSVAPPGPTLCRHRSGASAPAPMDPQPQQRRVVLDRVKVRARKGGTPRRALVRPRARPALRIKPLRVPPRPLAFAWC